MDDLEFLFVLLLGAAALVRLAEIARVPYPIVLVLGGLAVGFILSRQIPDGGFGSYEERRGGRWLHRLNPSEMFARCMIEDSYVECTGSCLSALARFRTAHPQSLRAEVERGIRRAERFIRKAQWPDGTWPAAWGIYSTYSAFFAVRGLRAAGASPRDPALVRAADWLAAHQHPDGGWGEHHRSALVGHSVDHPESQPTMTAWAVLSLLEIVGPNDPSVRRGADWLKGNRRADGTWPDGAVNGVFFGTSMLHYRLYPQYFPAWALAKSSSSAPVPTAS